MSSRSRSARDRLSEPVGGPKAVAVAVCFRRRDRQLQFRLVRTSDGERWTFPGGSLRLAEVPTQAAAREASEKAGVTGVIVEQPLTEFRYARRTDDVATAFLLAVQSTAPFGGEGRNPTWFDLQTSRERLAEGRKPAEAAELQRVIDVAEEQLRERR
ncbi:MAG TPA: NUDIX domain-containing protein [Solirubrobacteraceae bacterium]|nr:NUDIX domain-containing protein [Solirubrobacteraceae bacterium]